MLVFGGHRVEDLEMINTLQENQSKKHVTSLNSSPVTSLAKLSPYSSTARDKCGFESSVVKSICLFLVNRGQSVRTDDVYHLGSRGKISVGLSQSDSLCLILSNSQEGLTIFVLPRLMEEAT